MFSSIGLFEDTPCPQGRDCILLRCIFSHNFPTDETTRELPSQAALKNEDSPTWPATKRRRVETSDSFPPEPPRGTGHESEVAERKLPNKPELSTRSGEQPRQRTNRSQNDALKPARDSKTLQSIARPISPPAIPVARAERKPSESSHKNGQRAFQAKTMVINQQKPKEQLNPRVVQRSPATHPIRLAILQQLHKAMMSQNEKASKDSQRKSLLTLSADELIAMALDEEEKVARDNPTIYSNVIKQQVMKIRKMTADEWQSTVRAKLATQPAHKTSNELPSNGKRPGKISTSSLTAREELQVLRKLRTPLEGLESHGYVTNPPSDTEIESALAGIKAADGFEKCDRCGSRFQVFPGRREDGLLATGGTCTYHWAKLQRPQGSRTDAITGSKESFYPCCKESVSTSSGCTTSPTHVFKVSDAKRLASILQFKRTPEKNTNGETKKTKGAVTFDCEMGYTTMGIELIRLTAVAWPLGHELLDILVRPFGEILDLNTRFSGVTTEQMTNAVPYGEQNSDNNGTGQEDQTSEDTSEDGELSPEKSPPPNIASSPAEARQLLFDLLSLETPLIGHAIDNDLNAVRIIHPFVVDTVLLFPHPRHLPIRYGLKMLASKYLERDIQLSSAEGHDSKEDAIATGDLVRVKVAEKWKQMQIRGCQFENGVLIEPEKEFTVPLGPRTLTPQKRSLGQVDGGEDGPEK